MENIENQLGKAVRSLRTAAGLTQEGLAELLTEAGLPTRQNTIAKLENGLRPTTVREFVALASVFSMEPSNLAEVALPKTAGGVGGSPEAELAELRFNANMLEAELTSLEYQVDDRRKALVKARARILVLERYAADKGVLRRLAAGEFAEEEHDGVDPEAS